MEMTDQEGEALDDGRFQDQLPGPGEFPDGPSGRLAKLERRLLGRIARASKDFGMIGPGDRVMACVSGGKDSFAMLHLLRELQRRAPFDFSIVAVNLDQKQPGFPGHVIPEFMEAQGYEYRVVERDTYSVVIDKIEAGKTYCSLCSRLRRGILYDVAVELGATRIALGHHRDDIIETLLLNLFYSGQLKAMPPILRSDDGRNTVIRPLAYCVEEEIAEYAELMRFPIIPCDLCGSQENLQRKKVKALLATLHAENPKVKGNLLAALGNVKPTHLLDRDLWANLGLDVPGGQDDSISGLDGDDACGAGGEAPSGLAALGALRLGRR
jgi:tRNA 2-thiocytidine biosynthesis protein TtcA